MHCAPPLRKSLTNILVINLLPESGWSPLIRLGVGVLRLALVGTEDVCAPPTNTAPPTTLVITPPEAIHLHQYFSLEAH